MLGGNWLLNLQTSHGVVGSSQQCDNMGYGLFTHVNLRCGPFAEGYQQIRKHTECWRNSETIIPDSQQIRS